MDGRVSVFRPDFGAAAAAFDLDPRMLHGYEVVWRLLMAGLIGGLAVAMAFATQASTLPAIVSTATVGVVAAGASASVGGLVGFVFGIPRLLQDERPEPTGGERVPSLRGGGAAGRSFAQGRPASYAGNTSLEQISDWLTKILVGVGLTQLANVPAGLDALGRFVGPALGGFASSGAFASFLIVYFLVFGFFLSYLWTRLTLPVLFAQSDRLTELARVREEARREGQNELAQEAGDATAASAARAERLRALWVDDDPKSHQGERAFMTPLLNIEFDTAKSTDEALQQLEKNKWGYALVISDFYRTDDPSGGYTLLDRIREKEREKGLRRIPYILYTGSGNPEYDDLARRRTALGSTNLPSRLLELVRAAINEQPVRAK